MSCKSMAIQNTVDCGNKRGTRTAEFDSDYMQLQSLSLIFSLKRRDL